MRSGLLFSQRLPSVRCRNSEHEFTGLFSFQYGKERNAAHR
jgi:hypothetical protein